MDETKQPSEPAPDKRFNVNPVPGDDKENNKSAAAQQQLATQQQQLAAQQIAAQRDNGLREPHPAQGSQHIFVTEQMEQRMTMEDMRSFPDWFRKDQEYVELVSKQHNEADHLLDEMKARHGREKQNLYQKKIHINHTSINTRDR